MNSVSIFPTAVTSSLHLRHQLHRSSGQSPPRPDGHSYDVELMLALNNHLPEAKTDQENTSIRR